jgi:hypothetical protein
MKQELTSKSKGQQDFIISLWASRKQKEKYIQPIIIAPFLSVPKLVRDEILGFFSRKLVPSAKTENDWAAVQSKACPLKILPRLGPTYYSLCRDLVYFHAYLVLLTQLLLHYFFFCPCVLKQCGVVFKRSVSHSLLKINGCQRGSDLDISKGRDTN